MFIKNSFFNMFQKSKHFPRPYDNKLDLTLYSKNIYSQNGEDGILEEIFKRLKIEKDWACEFGAWDGKHLSNTFNLVKNNGWKCVMIESDADKFLDLQITAKQYTNIYALNKTIHYIEGYGELLDNILESTPIPKDFQLLSIDIDSCDYHVWKSLKKYEPCVVVIESSGLRVACPPKVVPSVKLVVVQTERNREYDT